MSSNQASDDPEDDHNQRGRAPPMLPEGTNAVATLPSDPEDAQDDQDRADRNADTPHRLMLPR